MNLEQCLNIGCWFHCLGVASNNLFNCGSSLFLDMFFELRSQRRQSIRYA